MYLTDGCCPQQGPLCPFTSPAFNLGSGAAEGKLSSAWGRLSVVMGVGGGHRDAARPLALLVLGMIQPQVSVLRLRDPG